MAISWGGLSPKRQRVGIQFVQTGANNDYVWIRVEIYTESQWNIADSQTMTLTGSWSGSVNYYLSGNPTGAVKVFEHTYQWGRSYGGGPTFTFGGVVSGHYAGDTPSHSASYTVPAKSPTPTSAPGTPSISSLTGTTATASWAAPSQTNGASVSNYNMHLARNSSFTTGLSSVSTGNASRSYGITGMTPGTTYYVRVRASNGYGWSGWSGTRSFTSLDYPSAPGTPSASPGDDGRSISASWGASSSNGGAAISTYQLQWATNTAFTANEGQAQPSGTTRSHTITGLSPGTTYYLRARARNSVGWGPWSGTRTVATRDTPSAPGAPSLSGAQPQQFSASWAAPSSNGGASVTNYQIQHSTSSSFGSGTVSATTGTTRSRTITGLDPATTYYVRVRAQNSVGWGPWSATGSIQTLSGAKVRVNGAWVDAVVHVRVSGAWRMVMVHKRVNGQWVL